ncbi:MAG: glycerol acyltransferase [Rhodobacterales bacterium]|nr:glycerol acyltransferase [Rhodobacterales bacterium]
MDHRIEPLIRDRAPWLYAQRPGTSLARAALYRLLGYRSTVALASRLEHFDSTQIMAEMGALLAHRVSVEGLGHLPAKGPALLVANHPTGIADGIILHHLIAPMRPDLFIYANGDILRVLPQMDDLILPVEWRVDRRSHGKTRETMCATRTAISQGRIGLIFPSGRLAKRRGLSLFERPWMTSAAMIARKFDLPVIPVNIRARNSALFYLFDAIHPTLRDVTLFHETLNKHRQPFTVRFGQAIPAADLPPHASDAIETLRAATLALGGRHAPAVSLIDTSRRPLWV